MSFPPGAKNDPRAPYNERHDQTQAPCDHCHCLTKIDFLKEVEQRWLCPDCVEEHDKQNREE